MKVYLSVPDTAMWKTYFPEDMLKELMENHDFRRQSSENLTKEEWIREIGDAECVISHWGTPKFTSDVLSACPNLKIIAHAAGSVAGVCSDSVFEKGITVITANFIMSKYVAEAILGHLITSLRGNVDLHMRMVSGETWPKEKTPSKSLFNAKIGFIGLGMVGRNLLHLLEPFAPEVLVFDPYIKEDALSKWPFARLVSSIDEAVSCRDAVTIQASKTRETYHMVNERVLSLMADGTHIVNCARGTLIDEKALVSELEKGRLYATLDVYEDEDHPEAIPFRSAPNITLLPHVGGAPSRENMTRAIIDALTLLEKGETTSLTVTHQQFTLMTHETLS